MCVASLFLGNKSSTRQGVHKQFLLSDKWISFCCIENMLRTPRASTNKYIQMYIQMHSHPLTPPHTHSHKDTHTEEHKWTALLVGKLFQLQLCGSFPPFTYAKYSSAFALPAYRLLSLSLWFSLSLSVLLPSSGCWGCACVAEMRLFLPLPSIEIFICK